MYGQMKSAHPSIWESYPILHATEPFMLHCSISAHPKVINIIKEIVTSRVKYPINDVNINLMTQTQVGI